MTRDQLDVTGGVDTHSRTHHAAALDHLGRLLGDQEFPADTAGYTALLAWLDSFGTLVAVGVEGTGTYGAGLTRMLQAADITVLEVDRPDRKARRMRGKSDPIDAINAARAVQADRATAIPKLRTGPVEAVRALRVARRGAVKARTAAKNQLHGLITSAPQTLREELTTDPTHTTVRRCARYRVDLNRLQEPTQATKAALRAIARRIQALDEEIAMHDTAITGLMTTLAPRTMALTGVGPQVAAQLVVTAGDNPERLRSEAALAHLCGIAPLPASSGRTHRHRLNRGGDRQANNAVHTIALTRLRQDQRTRDYAERRTQQGLSPRDIKRCLKRYIIREIYETLLADFAALNALDPT